MGLATSRMAVEGWGGVAAVRGGTAVLEDREAAPVGEAKEGAEETKVAGSREVSSR